MKAIAYFKNLPADQTDALQDITIDEPTPATTTCWWTCTPFR